jgi:hypothetical protein
MECQLKVAQSQNLSLSLKKSFIFPKQVEFVGVDIGQDGNQPTMSKHQLLVHWPRPVIVCNVAKFVGFLQFYSRFIPNFKVRILPLRKIMREDYTSTIGSAWTLAANAAFKEMRQAILSDPCLQRYDHCKLLVLCTNFLADGFGYVACQPADNEVSLAAMNCCMRDKGFDFMTKTSSAVLHPITFGCHRTHGNKTKLHSHLGKGFAGDWARHMCSDQRFTWVTDCYAIKFILLYDGRNPSILCLQMRFMCWDMDIEHQNDIFLSDANYWSRLGVDLCFDPLLKTYIEQVNSNRQRSPSLTALPPSPENMPYFRGPRLPKEVADAADSLTGVHISMPIDGEPSIGFQNLSNYAVRFGTHAGPRPGHAHTARPLYNLDVTVAASILSKFDWAVYGFNDGHFSSTLTELGMPFNILLACDPYANGQALFKEISLCPTILSSALALLDHIRASGVTAPMTGYLIHSHQYTSMEPTHRFWDIQAHIIIQLRLICSLLMVVAFFHPDHDCHAVSLNFTQQLHSDGWIITDRQISFPSFGDSISGT